MTRDPSKRPMGYDRKRDLLRKFGITVDFYNEMFAEQNGCCKICKRHQTNFKRRLHVDHNHTTGAIRGLLCSNCNTALGLFRDDTELLQIAKEYVS